MAGPYRKTHPHLRQQLIDRTAAGELLTAVCAAPGMPNQTTVRRWKANDLAFGEALALARQRGDWRRRMMFDEPKAKALLARLAAGERIASVLADPAMPSQAVYTRWRAEQGWFAEAVHRLNQGRAVKAVAAMSAARRRPWDPKMADAIVARVAAGAGLMSLLHGEPPFPSLPVVTRWRREHPAFDQALATAVRVGRRRARAAGPTQEVMERIGLALCEGETLNSLGRRPDMPCAATLYAWSAKHPAFAAIVARAYAAHDHAIEDDALDAIARTRPVTRKAWRATVAAARKGRAV